MGIRERDKPVDVLLGASEVPGPEEHGNRLNQSDSERQRMLHVRGVLDGLVRARHRLSRMALQPQSSRQNCAGQMSALKAEIDRRGPLSAQPTPDGAFEFGSGAAE